MDNFTIFDTLVHEKNSKPSYFKLYEIRSHTCYTLCIVQVSLLTLAFIFRSNGNVCIMHFMYLCVNVTIGMLQGMNICY